MSTLLAPDGRPPTPPARRSSRLAGFPDRLDRAARRKLACAALGTALGDIAWLSGAPAEVLLTREVRWFHSGALPTDVASWFTGLPGSAALEHRVDTYDIEAARRGVGIKRRNRESVDAKFLLRGGSLVDLAPGIAGRVEDWVKFTAPADRSIDIGSGIEVEKDIVTRRYPLHGYADAGCEVELATVRTGPLQAWTIALETFGPGTLLAEAFRAGVDALFVGAALPAGLRLGGEGSCAYPAWISRLVQIG